LAPDVYRPYARWLSEKDMFDEAQIGKKFQFILILLLLAYGKAGHDNEAFEVLQQLAEKAVLESRFLDASYYFRIMARVYLAKVYSNENEKSIRKRIEAAIEKADAYYVYDAVFRYVVSLLILLGLNCSLDGTVYRKGNGCSIQYGSVFGFKTTDRWDF
jgi:intraflagellar transport protein 122